MKTLFYTTTKLKRDFDQRYEYLCRMGGAEGTVIVDVGTDKSGYKSLKSPIGLRRGDTLVINDFCDFSDDGVVAYQELKNWHKQGVRVAVLKLTERIPTFNDEDWESYMETIEKLFGLSQAVTHGSRLVLKPLGRRNMGFPPGWEVYYNGYKEGKISAKECIDKLGLKRSTFYSKIQRWEALPQKTTKD